MNPYLYLLYQSARLDVDIKLTAPTTAGVVPHVPQEKQDTHAAHPAPSVPIVGVFTHHTPFSFNF